MNKNIFKCLILLMAVIAMASGCKKYEHYIDTGVTDAKFGGNVLEYLQSKPLQFDTLTQVIKLAGMEEVFKKENITFFAPQDPSIGASIDLLNNYLSLTGKDSVKKLSDIKPKVWKEMLSMYVYNGTNRLKDYRQVDTLALDTYAGQGYLSYNKTPLNIGVIYNDAKGGSKENPVIIKYAGYRQLMISYIPDQSKPKSFWYNALVSSSDINPTNGIVHSLRFSSHFFGFDPIQFIITATENGIGN